MSRYVIVLNNDYLAHYASPYYDPVKAHEYYMKTRKLKGKQGVSTAGLNDTGKEAQTYVQKTIGEERQREIRKHAKAQNEKAKTYADRAKSQISALSERLRNMSPAERKYRAGAIRQAVDRIRSLNNRQRAKLVEQHQKFAEKKSKEYESKYDSELRKIVGEAAFNNGKKGRKRKS